ncbi:MAG: hypothetical protein E6J14_06955 [Chloroflexi bacterium]|nr:MAG: hypothetical protein E6J14_06955 [Chloroflexota bacterium]
MDDRERSWDAPGLYDRVQENRRWQPRRRERLPWWHPMRTWRPRWTVTIVVMLFITIATVSAVTAVLARGGVGGQIIPAPQSTAAATPGCIDAPIAYSTRPLCRH